MIYKGFQTFQGFTMICKDLQALQGFTRFARVCNDLQISTSFARVSKSFKMFVTVCKGLQGSLVGFSGVWRFADFS